MFKRIKSLFSQLKHSQETPPATASNDDVSVKDGDVHTPKTPLSSHPITSQIMAWLDKQAWTYDHRLPEEGGIHHVIMGFTDRESDWTCVFRINEENQLVTVFGILEDSVPVSHYTAILMELAKININIGFGGIEFDPADGEVRAKIAFDAEFSALSEKSLGCYMQALAGLTEVARGVVQGVLADDSPSQFAGDYIDVGDEVRALVDDEKRTFFLPTQARQ